MTDKVSVFVYGTFRPTRPGGAPDDSRYYPQIAPYILASVPAQLRPAVLFDLGTYPGARPGEGITRGDLLTLKPEALAIMDRVEGHPVFFQRALVSVMTDAGLQDAWIYWAPESLVQGAEVIDQGDWLNRHTKTRKMGTPDRTKRDLPSESVPSDPTLHNLIYRLAIAQDIWLMTVGPDGRPHTALWQHVWVRGRIYLVTPPEAIDVTNIQYQPSVIVSYPNPTEPMIVAGWATLAPNIWAQIKPHFKAKIKRALDSNLEHGALIEITPLKLTAWDEQGKRHWSGGDLRLVDPFP